MKKKIVGLLLALAVSVSMTACTNVNGVEMGSSEQSQETQGSQSEEGQGTQAESKADSDKEGIKAPEVLADESMILYQGYYSDIYFGIDSRGNKVSEYRWEEARERLGVKEEDSYLVTVGDGMFLYYRCVTEENSPRYEIYAADVNGMVTAKLMTTEAGWWVDSVDSYDGKVYVNLVGNNSVRKEYVFAKEDQGFSFREETNPHDGVIKAMEGYGMTLRSASVGNQYGNCSITRVLEENGYVVGQKEGYFKIAKDGSISAITGISAETAYVNFYDQNGIVYDSWENENDTVYYLNLATGEVKQVARVENSLSVLAYVDGKVYYDTQEYVNDFNLVRNFVYEYDVAKGTSRLLYAKKSISGATDLQPGTQNFQVADGKLYFVDLVKDQIHWMRFDPEGKGTEEFRDTGLAVGEKSAFRYGKITEDTYVRKCSFCGTPLEKYYGELFELDDIYSAKADVINDMLRKEHEGVLESYEKYKTEVQETEDDCDEHREYPIQWCQTVEERVSGVSMIDGRYLAIDYDSYWYGGGVHGYPGLDQKLFDLTDGKEVFLKDFYQGTEEDYKKLVAQKTKEDCMSYDKSMSPYFGDPDSVYAQAYEEASVQDAYVTFNEKGINVLYAPYDMGPFASGFIEVFISYEELLGRPTLGAE